MLEGVESDTEQADADHKARVLRRHDQLLSDHRDLIAAFKKMIISHIDTIETAITLLDVMGALSPHTDSLNKEMREKKEHCEKKLADLLSLQSAMAN